MYRLALQLVCLGAGFIAMAPAFAQTPTTAQRNAIREACRSDYEAHCASVPTGGMPALKCLQSNMASLSPSCQKAVGAVGKSSATPAAAPAKAATTTAPAAAPAPPAAAQAPAAKPATVGAVPAAPPPPARALSPRQEIALVRTSCGSDFRAYCGNVKLGGGRAVACLRANAASLSPMCQSALLGARQR
jgi:hypothetical protein